MTEAIFEVSDQDRHYHTIDVAKTKNDADQLHGYRTADLRLLFSPCKKQVCS